jgi:hypothetical protein
MLAQQKPAAIKKRGRKIHLTTQGLGASCCSTGGCAWIQGDEKST